MFFMAFTNDSEPEEEEEGNVDDLLISDIKQMKN